MSAELDLIASRIAKFKDSTSGGFFATRPDYLQKLDDEFTALSKSLLGSASVPASLLALHSLEKRVDIFFSAQLDADNKIRKSRFDIWRNALWSDIRVKFASQYQEFDKKRREQETQERGQKKEEARRQQAISDLLNAIAVARKFLNSFSISCISSPGSASDLDHHLLEEAYKACRMGLTSNTFAAVPRMLTELDEAAHQLMLKFCDAFHHDEEPRSVVFARVIADARLLASMKTKAEVSGWCAKSKSLAIVQSQDLKVQAYEFMCDYGRAMTYMQRRAAAMKQQAEKHRLSPQFGVALSRAQAPAFQPAARLTVGGRYQIPNTQHVLAPLGAKEADFRRWFE